MAINKHPIGAFSAVMFLVLLKRSWGCAETKCKFDHIADFFFNSLQSTENKISPQQLPLFHWSPLKVTEYL